MFTTQLADHLSRFHSMIDLGTDYPELNLDYLGIRETKGTIDLLGLVTADGWNEAQITSAIDEFFDLVLTFSKDLFFNKLYKPNAVLAFVWQKDKPSYRIQKWLPKQSKISHATLTGRSVLPWLIDVTAKQIIPHKNPVSWFPTVVSLHNPPVGVYPGLKIINTFLQQYDPSSTIVIKKERIPVLSEDKKIMVQRVEKLIEKGAIRQALKHVKNAIARDHPAYTELVILLNNQRRLQAYEIADVLSLDEFNNYQDTIIERLLEVLKRMI